MFMSLMLLWYNFIQESLVRVAVWCIGEYGDMLVNNVGMLDVEDPITVSLHFHAFQSSDVSAFIFQLYKFVLSSAMILSGEV